MFEFAFVLGARRHRASRLSQNCGRRGDRHYKIADDTAATTAQTFLVSEETAAKKVRSKK
jgi:hypothetical protein